jgi:VanZ family protein
MVNAYNRGMMTTFPEAIIARLRAVAAPIRLVMACLYLALLTITLLQPSRTPLIGPAAPPGPPDLSREIFLTAMHVLGFSMLVLILWWTFTGTTSPRRALWIALGLALLFSPLTELLQMAVPGRGASWWDWGTNTACTLAMAALIRWRAGSR